MGALYEGDVQPRRPRFFFEKALALSRDTQKLYGHIATRAHPVSPKLENIHYLTYKQPIDEQKIDILCSLVYKKDGCLFGF